MTTTPCKIHTDALVDRAVSTFRSTATSALAAWESGIGSRSASLAHLDIDLRRLVERAAELSGAETADELLQLTSIAMAVACRTDDADHDDSTDDDMLAEGEEALASFIASTARVAGRTPQTRDWTSSLPRRLEEIRSYLAGSPGDAAVELIGCTATALVCGS